MLRKGLEKRMQTLQKEREDKNKSGQASADIRIVKDLGEIDLSETTSTLTQPDKDNIRELLLTMRPETGYYKGGEYFFRVLIPHDYPHTPPKVVYDLKDNVYRLFHPNIDEDGKVCLNILRADWRPVLNLKAVVFGMELLFREPNPDDPLNKRAAKMLREDKVQFERTVRSWMNGNYC